MNVALFSLLVLIAVIVVGFIYKINVGLLGIAFAYIIGHFFTGMKESAILDGWPLRLFFMLLGMMLIFSVARANGTLEFVAKKFSTLPYVNTKLVPWVIFFLAAVVSGVGVGPITVPAIMSPLFVEIAREEDIPENLALLMGASGAIAGGFTNLAPTGIVAHTLAAQVGVESFMPIGIRGFLTFFSHGVIFYLLLGGLRLKNHVRDSSQKIVLEKKQLLTLIVIITVIIAILVFKLDIGFAAFTGYAILLLFNVGDQDKAIAGISWGTLFLICGVSILVNVVKVSGGIDAVSKFLTAFMNERSAATIMTVLAGLMSSVSSATGVVMPTLIPTLPGIAAELGAAVSVQTLVTAVVIGSLVVPYSPLSTVGAFLMGAASERSDKHALFTQLLIVAFSLLVLTSCFFWAGVYN